MKKLRGICGRRRRKPLFPAKPLYLPFPLRRRTVRRRGGEGGFGNTTAVRERMVRAALRGTTVHKILEAMDIASIGSVRDVDRLIEKLLSEGRVDPEGAKTCLCSRHL